MLAVVGIFGVMSYAVTQQTREIGIRIALGADRSAVVRMVLQHAMLLAGTGLAIGLVAALALARTLSSMLFDLSPNDPLTFAAVLTLLALVAAGRELHPGATRHARRSGRRAAGRVARLSVGRLKRAASGSRNPFGRGRPSAARRRDNPRVSGNVYFELTRAFNASAPIAALASGQAVVYYRIAIMSKDGDWVIRETAPACSHVIDVLARRGATYRPGAPLDPRWLAGGWSSHFEFFDEKKRRVRCDFFTRPPRIAPERLERLFREAADPLLVIDLNC